MCTSIQDAHCMKVLLPDWLGLSYSVFLIYNELFIIYTWEWLFVVQLGIKQQNLHYFLVANCKKDLPLDHI